MKDKNLGDIIIEIKKLGVDYTGSNEPVKAIHDINLTIHRGDFICVLGPSGCGKSTLLKVIAGFLKQTEGTFLMNGKEVVGPDWNRGVVFQSASLYPWMSVRKNIEFGPKMKRLPKKDITEIATHYLEQVNLLKFEDQVIFELSGGMKQRVALARVLANEPEVMLMDEPLGALDALTRIQMQKLIRDIWKKNHNTIFMITHDVDEALSLGTRVLVMSSSPGTIIKELNLDFIENAVDSRTGRVQINEEYLKLKEAILDLIDT
ncbi:ABC transporter ATP-binding protein [Acetobacterium bakii]|uniref:ABC transporter ATP-binding protein n=1 Tax=Acetobacterium bakii TaxID=52689 RepID=A0A0L6U4F7_9FIRM|nr:ABC transporter ATP-binding protein [Acetobacterium bakii]KNZ43378.1 ABC transporter ATP-binding protein [Acetobacterium bakii]